MMLLSLLYIFDTSISWDWWEDAGVKGAKWNLSLMEMLGCVTGRRMQLPGEVQGADLRPHYDNYLCACYCSVVSKMYLIHQAGELILLCCNTRWQGFGMFR